MTTRTQKDLEARELTELSWDPNRRSESLNAVFEMVTNEAKEAITWYLNSKRRKRRGAVFTRVAAITAAALAGILPMLSQIFLTDGRPVISPAWASVVLGVAAALLAFDRFFGFSSSWMRFIAAELRLRHLLQEFQMDWAAEMSTWKGTNPSDDQVQRMIARAKLFRLRVGEIIQEETNSWVTEFQAALKQLDEAAKAKAGVSELGGLNIFVGNGDKCDDGWTLSIDGGSVRSYTGKTAAIRDVIPGVHTLRVIGNMGGTPKQAETAVSVSAGGIASAELTLS